MFLYFFCNHGLDFKEISSSGRTTSSVQRHGYAVDYLSCGGEDQAIVFELRQQSITSSILRVLVAVLAHNKHVFLICGFGLADDEGAEMVWGALLNQASALIRLKKFEETEVRCSKLLEFTSEGDGGRAAAARGRAYHFRGFSR